MAGKKRARGTAGKTGDGEVMLRLDTIGGKLVVSPANKRFDYREIPKHLLLAGWTRDKDLEKTIAYQCEHIYKKEFKPSEENDESAVIIARVSENKTSFQSCQRLGVFAVEVLSFEGAPPYDENDLKDLLRGIRLAVFDLSHEACVPFVPKFKFHTDERIDYFNTSEYLAYCNGLYREDLHLLETEREFYKAFASKELPASLVESLVRENFPDEPRPKM